MKLKSDKGPPRKPTIQERRSVLTVDRQLGTLHRGRARTRRQLEDKLARIREEMKRRIQQDRASSHYQQWIVWSWWEWRVSDEVKVIKALEKLRARGVYP